MVKKMQAERLQWLENRRKMIGASDVAAILGENPFRTNVNVWMDKTGRGKMDFDNDHLKFGRDVEGAIAGLYETRTERPVKDLGATVVQVHHDIPWLGATLDRITTVECPDSVTRDVPLELKHVGGIRARKDEWEDDPPSMYQIQVQIQCACYGAPYGVLAGMFPGYQLAWVDMEYSKDFFETIFPVIDEFWNHYVAKDICPPLLEHDRNIDTMKELYRSDNGETVVLNHDVFQLVQQWEEVKNRRNDSEKKVKEIEAHIRSSIGNATFAALPDGTFLTAKTTKRKEYTVEPCEFRTIRRTKKLR